MQTIGKYEVLEVIGHGGMGLVYRARDNAIGRHVALKVMAPALAEQAELRERFLREARAAGNLQHPNIVVIYDLGEDNGAPYIAMEFLEGEPLDKALAANRLTTRTKLETFAHICDGLHFAHLSGVIHRDVKPANVILLAKGGAKLVDFGIARTGGAGLTRTGMMIGTVAYMAPEQLKAKPVDARSDVFSAGAMLYEMLAGKLPFEGESTAETMMRILQEPPPELKVEGTVSPQSLAEIVQRALEKDPADRYQTAREFGEAVRDYLLAQDLSGMRATTARPTPPPPQARPQAAAPTLAPTRVNVPAPEIATPRPTRMRAEPPAAAAARAADIPGEENKNPAKKVVFIALALVVVFGAALAWNQMEKGAAQRASSEIADATRSLGGSNSPAATPVTPTSPIQGPSASAPASTPTPTPSAPETKTEPKQGERGLVKVVPEKPPLPTWHSTASGVQYLDSKVGTGAEAVPGKDVIVVYRGHLLDGTPFDAANAGKPVTLPLGKNMLIKGWEEGIPGMKVGGKRRLRVPPEAGYGAAGIGTDIPPNSTLIFDIELLKVE
ncbi:MAG: protein kinase [Candidatus Koribacter versatilis]|uniref:peptidylprolyl isomerase n=1 Tax=Candidatus Korobacter versatilis TaxID=658062 RepID=A0A932A731_9BACT|nr:protein kinase [Candidatus Koribacter versatilis]